MSDVVEGNEQYGKLLDDLTERAKHVGLYLQGGTVQCAPEELGVGSGQMIVIATFVLGERAFDTPVQDPQQARFDEDFRTIVLDAEEAAEAEEIANLRDLLRGDET